MIFVYRKWNSFCKKIRELNAVIKPAKDISADDHFFVVLKHDVETNVRRAYRMALIEHKNGVCGTYYIQAYLLKKLKNIKLLKKMQSFGHEISYHYDVMDSNKGDINKALDEFETNKKIFEDNGFTLNTVCQHGNPFITRNGYTSNRDFFRNEMIQKKYKEISDIMVNFKQTHCVDYSYYSDAGRVFKFIFDPINNDVVDTSDKDFSYKNLNELFFDIKNNAIISTHPHRWCNSSIVYCLKTLLFKFVKITVKIVYKIPYVKQFIDKHYYLAKKF